jgi:hypothetical protein
VPVADDSSRVLAGCIGEYGDGGASAGIAMIEIGAKGAGKLVQSYRVADHAGAANVSTPLLSLGGDVVLAVAAGSLDASTQAVATPDAAYRVDLHAGEQTMVASSDGAFSLGVPAFDSASGKLLLPDAGSTDNPRYGVQRFTLSSDGELASDGFVQVAPSATLPVREVHHL